MLTASSRSTARVSASRPRAMPCTISVSAIWLPIVNTGLSAVIGSWNTRPIPAPRTFCIARSSSVSRSCPLNNTLPPAMRPGRCTSRMIENAVTDLPLPDSPTRHRVSPASTWKLTSFTAGAGPAGRSNTVVRCSTDSSAPDVRGPASDGPFPGRERYSDRASDVTDHLERTSHLDFAPRTSHLGLRTSDFELWTSDLGPRTSDLGLRTSDLGPRTSDVGRRTADVGRRTSDFGPRTSDCGLRTSDLGLRTSDFGPRTSDLGLRTSDFAPRTSDVERRTSDFGRRTSDFGLRTSDLGPRTSVIQHRHPCARRR